jgi:DNA-binding CsgD family transcriptional regulator
VLRLLAVGRSAREVAAALGISYYTARHHVEHVLAKLGVHTRAAVAAAVTDS